MRRRGVAKFRMCGIVRTLRLVALRCVTLRLRSVLGHFGRLKVFLLIFTLFRKYYEILFYVFFFLLFSLLYVHLALSLLQLQ